MITEIFSNLNEVAILSFLGSFVVVYTIIPMIRWVVDHHKLIDTPDIRSSHKRATPTMGGVAFFIALMLVMFLFKKWDVDSIGFNLVAAMTIMFAVGLKDDLVLVTPRARIIAEIVAISIIFLNSDLDIVSFNGFLGVYVVPETLTYVVLILVTVTIINAYNLIDGADGLATSIAIVILSIYGFIFYKSGLYFYFLICTSLIAMMIAFLRFNFSSRRKIFMGDTGSLFIGFCIAFLTLKFLMTDVTVFRNFSFYAENRLIVVAAILSVPLFDMFRLIGTRFIQRKSLFEADRNHIHHILMDNGLAHYKIAVALGLSNYILLFLLIYLAAHYNSYQMLGIVFIIFVLLLILFYQLKNRANRLSKLESPR